MVYHFILNFLVSQPLNVTIRESEARKRNKYVCRRIEVPKNSVAKLGRQTLEPTSQPKPHVCKGAEEGRSRRKMVEDEFAQVERQVAFVFL